MAATKIPLSVSFMQVILITLEKNTLYMLSWPYWCWAYLGFCQLLFLHCIKFLSFTNSY